VLVLISVGGGGGGGGWEEEEGRRRRKRRNLIYYFSGSLTGCLGPAAIIISSYYITFVTVIRETANLLSPVLHFVL